MRNDSINLTPHSLVLCHLGLCQRNLIFKDDEVTLCLVDWEFAGLYLRFFEVAVIPCMMPYDAPYENRLLQEIDKVMGPTNEEKRLIKLVRCVRAAYLR